MGGIAPQKGAEVEGEFSCKEGRREWLAAYNNQAAGFLRLDPPQTLNRLPRGSLGKIRRAELARALAGK